MDALRDSRLLSHPALRARRTREVALCRRERLHPGGQVDRGAILPAVAAAVDGIFVAGFAPCFVFIIPTLGVCSCSPVAVRFRGAIGAR